MTVNRPSQMFPFICRLLGEAHLLPQWALVRRGFITTRRLPRTVFFAGALGCGRGVVCRTLAVVYMDLADRRPATTSREHDDLE